MYFFSVLLINSIINVIIDNRIGVILVDFIITFFRDVLDGPLYTVVSLICGILICSCIGYLGEQYLKKKESEKEYNETHATVSEDVSSNVTAVSGEVSQSKQ